MLTPQKGSSYQLWEEDMKRICRSLALTLFIYLFTHASLSLAQTEQVNINGTVTFDENPANCMVLANGQYMFTGNAGYYDLEIPLDENGQITLYSFAANLAPYREILTPSGDVTTRDIQMVRSDSTRLPYIQLLDKRLSEHPNRRILSGTVSFNEEFVSAMVLINGQNMFTSVSDGFFELDVPLDADGNITFYCFISGFSPFKLVFNADALAGYIVLDPVLIPLHQKLLGEWTFEYTINPTYEKTYFLDKITPGPSNSDLPMYVLGSDASGNDVRAYNIPGTIFYELVDYARYSEGMADVYHFVFITDDSVAGNYFEVDVNTGEAGEIYPTMTGSRVTGP
jgi:hypothetical protein